MKVGGSNKYKIPHLKKYTLESIGLLPKQLSCEATLVEDVLNTLKKFDQLLFFLFCVLVSSVRFLSFIWDFTVSIFICTGMFVVVEYKLFTE